MSALITKAREIASRHADKSKGEAYDENHKKFLSHLDDSQEAVFMVAKILWLSGYSVQIPSVSRASERAEWKQHADDGDLYISQHADMRESKRVEVKNLSASFTNRNNWPFGNKFIVCARHAFDRADKNPYVYVILSSDKMNAAIVMSESHDRWYIETRKDSRYVGVEQEFYFANLDDVKFISLDGKLPL